MSDEAGCPVCSYVDLREVTLDSGLRVDRCEECGGYWYDAGELESAVANPVKLREAIDAGLIKPRPSSRQCPRCGQNLTNTGLINQFLRVDLCTQCRGFWLDKNESGLIDKLISASA